MRLWVVAGSHQPEAGPKGRARWTAAPVDGPLMRGRRIDARRGGARRVDPDRLHRTKLTAAHSTRPIRGKPKIEAPSLFAGRAFLLAQVDRQSKVRYLFSRGYR